MLGVIAAKGEERVVREFFELFKTPWAFCQEGGRYDVVLSAGDGGFDDTGAKLLIVYAGEQTKFDAEQGIQSRAEHGGKVSFGSMKIPIYGQTLTFQGNGIEAIAVSERGEPVAVTGQRGQGQYVRVGYDLFREVRTLLEQGQPVENALTPTLELHTELLLRLILGGGLPVVEIPPVPQGHSFIACLTHDLDHASIRRHKLDATMLGFLYRATIASSLKAACGRLPLRRLLTNWTAVARLPLVYMGLAEDFWYGFDRYLELEGGRPSTFFVIPFSHRPGRSPNGKAPAARGAGYDVADIAPKIQKLAAAGVEVGVHGIDAWSDSALAREESKRVSDVSLRRTAGVRMHWLYQNADSPAVLDEAEFEYDSTVGYNEAVGYRAGTSQVFKPLRVNRLLELPLHIMDTALFYPDRLGLSEDEAWTWLRPMVDNAVIRGGVLTINWHDRSIAPERLWGNFYVRLIGELTRKGALFCNGTQTVSWFQKRRSATFERVDGEGKFRVRIPETTDKAVPALRLRFHRPRNSWRALVEAEGWREDYTDLLLQDGMEFRFPN